MAGVWVNQFDLLSHIPYTSVAHLTADVLAAGSQALPILAAETPGEWRQAALAAAGTVLAGSAASCLGFENANVEYVETDHQTVTKEVCKMAYRSASWRSMAQTAFEPKPLDQMMPIKTFLEQARTLRPQQLAAELEAKGCLRLEDLIHLQQRDPELWAKMRLHSGHENRLVQSIQFSVDGSWPSNALVPAPVVCKSKLNFPHKQKSWCYLLANSSVVLADRRFQQATDLRAGAQLQSFDVPRSRIANSKVVRCSQESLGHVGVRMMQHVLKNGDQNSTKNVIKVTLFDQMMKQYTLEVLEGQPLWALTPEGYSWVSAGKGHQNEMKPGDKLVHYRKHLCVVVDITVQPSTFTDRLVHVSLQGIPTIFMDGFLAAATT